MPLFATTIAGSLPKPAWLAEPNRLWAPWRAAGAALADAKRSLESDRAALLAQSSGLAAERNRLEAEHQRIHVEWARALEIRG